MTHLLSIVFVTVLFIVCCMLHIKAAKLEKYNENQESKSRLKDVVEKSVLNIRRRLRSSVDVAQHIRKLHNNGAEGGDDYYSLYYPNSKFFTN